VVATKQKKSADRLKKKTPSAMVDDNGERHLNLSLPFLFSNHKLSITNDYDFVSSNGVV
jgi:hypothetical protein